MIKAGNLIENADVERLREKLEQIRKADKDELKAMYKETLKGETPEGSKGAGVGFIEIARRSSRPISSISPTSISVSPSSLLKPRFERPERGELLPCRT